jgi:arabinose-5-phosphate isomerase
VKIDRAEIIRRGEHTLRAEAEAVRALAGRLDPSFADAVEALFRCPGKVIITGVGKSGIIGAKIASTLTSTGTPAIFVHAAEASHGDLGMFRPGDAVIAISNSGESEEVVRIIPALKRLGLPIIGMTGGGKSTLARESDILLDISVAEEACPLGLAPTSSTTATLAMGDALAVALLSVRGFREEDFALIHPGGKLGRRWLRVADLMHTGGGLPRVSGETLLKDALVEMSSKKLGLTTVVDGEGRLSGILTDGDLRRLLERNVDFYAARVTEVMTRNPRRIEPDSLGARAVQVMEAHAITALVVTDGDGRPLGVIHLHDLLKAGVV